MGIPDIRLVNLSKHYGDVVAVDSISLEIQPGVYCCLLGPSGCGKTSTLRMIAGHESNSSGSIYVGTQEVSKLPPAQRNTAMMFQDYALFPHMSLVDNVAFGLKMRSVGKKERRKRAEVILDLVGMSGHLQQRPGHLSGGQRQRVALARALITEPAVVLLDEPLSALDRFLRVRMRGELRRLQQQFGVTFIHVTHSQEEALALADLVVVMEGGRIQQVGPPREVYNQARTPFVASFIGDHNVLQGRVVARDAGVVAVEGEGGRHYAIAGPAQLGEIMCFTVRADHARLVHSAPPDVNVISGTAVAVEYAGHFMRVRLTTAGGIEFLVYVPDEEFVIAPVTLGQTVGASWPTAAAVPLMVSA